MDLSPATRYMYRVRAFSQTGASDYTNTVTVATWTWDLPVAPVSPQPVPNQGLIVEAGPDRIAHTGDTVSLSGSLVSDPSRGGASSPAWTVVDANGQTVASGPGYTVSFVPAGDGLFVATFSMQGLRGAVGTDSVTITVQEAPHGRRGVVGPTPPAANRVVLSWLDHATDETGYRIERKTEPNGTFQLVGTAPADSTSYTDQWGLRSNTQYTYRVQAYNLGGPSPYSLPATVTTPVAYPLVNVADFGAAPDDGLDDTAAIQAAINAAGTGGTISFGTGRYNPPPPPPPLSSALILKGGRTYEGNNATLAIPAGADFVFRSTAAIASVQIQDFNFEGGGINLAYAGTGITIANNTFTQFSGSNYRNNGVFIAGGLTNSAISANRFFNNPGGDNAILGFGRWDTVQVVDNVIDNVNEGIHILFGPTKSTNTADHSWNVEVSRNTITHVRRIGIELQSLVHHLIVSGNRISDWLLPAAGHMALSVATTENDPANNSTDIQIINNVLIGNGQVPNGNDCAIEAAGNQLLISGNYVANWGGGQLVAVTTSWQTTNNTWAGITGSIINPNNGYTPPSLNSGNIIIPVWDGTIPA